MIVKFVLVLTALCNVIPVYADAHHHDAKSNNNHSFELSPNTSSLYQPWPVTSNLGSQASAVPPPPPGPYISSALSTQDGGFPQPLNPEKIAPHKSSSPLMRPETPWPVKQFQPQMWMPKNGVTYAPPNLTRMRPNILSSMPPQRHKPLGHVRPNMYNHPNHLNYNNRHAYQGVTQRPNLNNSRVINPRINNPSHDNSSDHNSRSNNHHPINRYPVQQPSNAWMPFDMPMSNYPHQNHPTRMSAPHDLNHPYNRTMPHNMMNRMAPMSRNPVPVVPRAR